MVLRIRWQKNSLASFDSGSARKAA